MPGDMVKVTHYPLSGGSYQVCLLELNSSQHLLFLLSSHNKTSLKKYSPTYIKVMLVSPCLPVVNVSLQPLMSAISYVAHIRFVCVGVALELNSVGVCKYFVSMNTDFILNGCMSANRGSSIII